MGCPVGSHDFDDDTVAVPIRTLLLAGLSLFALDADRILAKRPQPETTPTAQIQHIENAIEDLRYDLRAAREDHYEIERKFGRKIDGVERSILVVSTQVSLINSRSSEGN